MIGAKSRYGILHLLVLVGGFAVVVCLRGNLFLGAVGAILIFGPAVAHATTPTFESMFAGMLAAAFWTIMCTFVTGPFFIRHDLLETEMVFSQWLLAIPILASMLGGFLGAKVTTQ